MSAAPPDLLEAIVAATRHDVEARRARVPYDALEQAAWYAPNPRGGAFEAALRRPDGVNLIAECKRRSPSRGVLAADYDPVAQARAYARGGAAAVSVLTEPSFFGGALVHLSRVRAAIDVPVLRKDFVVDPYQLLEARLAGADAVLLIVSALDDDRLARLLAQAATLRLAALVEVHDEHELQRALDVGAVVIGVNNRNLRTLAVDLDVSARLAARLPGSATAVSESGVGSAADVERLRSLGYHAFLVGERLMSSADPEGDLRRLRGEGPLAVSDIRIKVCGITRPDDAAVAGRADVDAVGFVLWPGSPRAVTVDAAAQLGRALPPWTVRVGVFVAVSVDAVAAAVAAAGLGAVQLHGVADPTPYLRLAVPLLWSMPLRDGHPDPAAPAGTTLMLDAYDPRRHGGTGRPVDWGRAATIARRERVVLGGGLTPDNIAEAIAIVRPYGVDVSSGVEETPGIKSAARLLAFVEAARRSAREAHA